MDVLYGISAPDCKSVMKFMCDRIEMTRSYLCIM